MKRIILYGWILIGLLSCKDEFLERKPLDALSDADVWQDISLAESYVNNIYKDVYDGFRRRHDTWGYGIYLLDAGSDDGKTSFTWSESEKLNFNNYTPADAPLRYTWSDMYQAIRKANQFLERIDAVPNGTQDVKDRLKGEVKFLRAWFYFELMKQYGGVPIIRQSQGLDENLEVSRNTYDECADFVVRELDEAAALPIAAPQVGRATKGSALALKSRVLLYWASPLNNPGSDNARWQRAAQAAQDVISLGKYALFSDYRTLFQPENENNVEVIFDKQYRYPAYVHGHDTYHTPYSKGNFASGWGGTSVTQEFVDAYEMVDGKMTTQSPLYDPQAPYQNRDPRFYATVLFDGAQFTIGGKEVTIETRVGGENGLRGNQDATKTGYYLGKFLNRNYVVNYARDGGFDSEQNWILLRYAEILLNYAEAQNEAAGPDGTVYAALNLIRDRAGMPDLPGGLAKDAMRDRIRNERRVELAFEEHRFWDIRRWKIAQNVLNGPVHGVEITAGPDGRRTFNRFPVETRYFQPRNYVEPIIQEEINKNKNLQQNQGW